MGGWLDFAPVSLGLVGSFGGAQLVNDIERLIFIIQPWDDTCGMNAFWVMLCRTTSRGMPLLGIL